MNDNFGGHDVPKIFGVCPRCKGQLFADVYECDGASGEPTECGFHVFCKASREAFEMQIAERIENKDHRTPIDHGCDWDYDDLLTANRKAYDYLKQLKNPEETL